MATKTDQIFYKTMDILKSNFKINKKSLIEFTEISGDWNPIHHDEEVSRRYKTEKPINHGILTLLEVLNIFLEDKSLFIYSIKCNFLKPVYPDHSYQLYKEDLEENSKNIYLYNKKNLVFNCNVIHKIESIKINNNILFDSPNKNYPLSPSSPTTILFSEAK